MEMSDFFKNDKHWHIEVGNSIDVLKTFPDKIFQTTITSPPYYQLRDYGYEQQIGQEDNPKDYIDNLVNVFKEIKRCTRDDGTCWINLGDKYTINTFKDLKLKRKDLMCLPFELATALRSDGWYLRQFYPWVKSNSLPENVSNRPNTSLEYVILLSKTDKYYFDMESAKECLGIKRNWRNGDGLLFMDVPTEQTEHSHFAVMPTELARIMIKSTTSEQGCCTSCQTPLKRIITKQNIPGKNDFNGKSATYYENESLNSRTTLNSHLPNHLKHTTVETIGWEHDCKCTNQKVTNQIVFDPFSGAATTGSVALSLGSNYIGIELNPEYANYSVLRLLKENNTIDIFKNQI